MSAKTNIAQAGTASAERPGFNFIELEQRCDERAEMSEEISRQTLREAAAAIRQLRHERHLLDRSTTELLKAGGYLADGIAQLRADNATMREALKPFAEAWRITGDIGEQGGGFVEDDSRAWVSGGANGNSYPMFKFGDLRRAHTLVAMEKNNGD